MQTNYADTILNISITGPLVRIDLGTVVPTPNDQDAKKLRAKVTQQLVMPIDGFARAFAIQEKIMKKLVANGVFKKIENPEQNQE
jgi:hypothetical protein